jgi:hypothetical protein
VDPTLVTLRRLTCARIDHLVVIVAHGMRRKGVVIV